MQIYINMKFVRCNIKDCHHCCCCNCWLTGSVLYIMSRFVTYLYTKFHLPSFSFAVKQRTKENSGMTIFIHSFIGMCRMQRCLAVLRSFFHSSLLCTLCLHSVLPTSPSSFVTSSCLLFLGLPLSLVDSKFILKTFL